jgi:S1-C subfamily serine protease
LKFDIFAAKYPRYADQYKQLHDMAKQAEPSAVEITIDSTLPGMEKRGTGFFVTAQGHGASGTCEIATDNHVVAESLGKPRIELLSGEKFVGEVELNDPAHDTAVLKITGVENPAKTCPVLPLGSPDSPSPGEPVARVSFKYSAAGLFTGESERFKAKKIAQDPGEDMNRSIHIFDMNSAPGDSGSAIFNSSGKVTDLTWAAGKETTAGTPVDALKRDLDQIHRGK